MTRVHLLTEGFVAPNTRAVIFPLTVWRRELKEVGLTARIFTEEKPDLFACDLLVVESNFHGKRWTDEREEILAEMAAYKQKAPRLAYLDASDSTALLHPEILPFVDTYFKGQLLKNRSAYKERLYGNRIFTDFCHRHFNIEDAAPTWSETVVSDSDLDKLAIWHNSSLADYSLPGRYKMELFAKTGFRPFLAFPRSFHNPTPSRSIDVSCRMGINYDRATVAWFRTSARDHLSPWAPADRLSHRAYVKELQNSKIVASPFGWGEINYKDYETFLAGALLLKPDMSHMETWPALYVNGETYAPYDWDGENLNDTVRELLANEKACRETAAAGQSIYRHHIADPEAPRAYCERLLEITKPTLN